VDHRHGGSGKHISSIDEVKARNNGEESAYDRARRVRREGAEDSEEEEEPKQQQAPKGKATGLGGIEVENPNAVKRNEDKEGVELTRKQREEIEKAAARRRYEELHKAGKTDEAKADLARLEEVKKRREEAQKKRQEEAAEAAAKQEAEKGKGKSVLAEELKGVGCEDSRMRGSRSSKKKEEKDGKEEKDPKDAEKESGKKIMNGVDENEVYNSYADAVSTKKADVGERFQPTDGSIESCRAAEADFM